MAEPYSQLFSGLNPANFSYKGTPSDLGSFQQQGKILEQLRTDVANAPEVGSIDAETGQITLGKPLKFDVYKYYDGTDLQRSYSIPDIATLVVEQLHRFPPGTTDKLRETMTDEEIVTRLTLEPSTGELYRVPSLLEGAYEGLGRGFIDIAGGIAGGKAAGALTGGNPYAALGGFGVGLLASSQLQNALFPDERPLPNRMNPILTSQFVASSLGGAGLPYMVREGAMEEGFARLISPNIKNLPYIRRVNQLAEGTGRVVETGFRTARNQPVANLVAETGAIGAGALLSSVFAGEDSTPTMRRAAFETLGAILNPMGVVQGITSGAEGYRQFKARMSVEGRRSAISDQLVNILNAVQEGDAVAVRNLLNSDSELAKILRAKNIDVGNQTTAEKAGHPTLFALQGSQARRDPAGFGARTQTRAQEQLNELERLMAALIEVDDPAALGLLDEARKNYFQANLETQVARAYQRYEEALGTLTRGGENIDEDRLLANLLKEVMEGAREQEKVFYQRIPDSVESDASNLMDAASEIREATQVGRQSVRLDTGQNPISIKVALRDFAEILGSDDPALAQGIESIVKEIEEGPLPGLSRSPFITAPDAPEQTGQMELPAHITSGQLKNLHGVITEGLRREKKGMGSQTMLGQSLATLEEAIRKDLANLPEVGPDVKVHLDNALAFSEEFNNVFRRSFLGENFLSRRNIPPEDLLRQILIQPPSLARLALGDIENAVTFLQNQLIEGTVPDSEVANRMLRGEMVLPPGSSMAPGDRALFNELNQIGPRLNTVRVLQEKAMRGFFNKHRKIGPDGRYVVDHPAILTYLDNPDNVALLEQISPPITINGERQSPLINDLRDTAKASRLYQQTMQTGAESAVLNEAHRQIPLLAFLNPETGLGIRDVPGNAIDRILGSPGKRPDNAITDFRDVARSVANVTQEQLDELRILDPDTGNLVPLSRRYSPADLKEALYQTVVSQGFVDSGFESPRDATPFTFRAFQDYMTKPITPGTAKGPFGQRASRPAEGVRQPSPLDILREERVIDDTTFQNFDTLLKNAVRIEDALATGDADLIAQMFSNNPITAELVQRVVGAQAGQALGRALPGPDPDLIAGAAGSQALRNLLDKTPSLAFKDLWKEVLTNPETMVDILNLGIERAEKGIATDPFSFERSKLPFDAKGVQILRAALLGTGVANLPSVRDILIETYGSATDVLGDIFIPRQEPPPETPPPQAMTDQARRFLPQMPLPQATPPVAQAQANPNTRAQLAAMYPNDITSDLIRSQQQGIGSLIS